MRTLEHPHCVRCSLFLSLLFSWLMGLATVSAQTVYTARVVDAETGEALPLVGVYVSSDNATLTNFDGDFSLTAAPSDVVRFTCIGRETIVMRAEKVIGICISNYTYVASLISSYTLRLLQM